MDAFGSIALAEAFDVPRNNRLAASLCMRWLLLIETERFGVRTVYDLRFGPALRRLVAANANDSRRTRKLDARPTRMHTIPCCT
jgi:hypothetical protein